MDIAIVTGASSALGQAISRRLIQLGFRVYGLGGNYADCPLQNVNFRPISCDLANPEAVESACRQILEKEKGVYLIVNNAKYFGKTTFAEMDRADLERILRINLLCPLILTRYFGESLKKLQGYLIQLGAPRAESCRGGAAGAAATGGLKWMGDYLFTELRDNGVKVCHLSPEPNRVWDARTRIRKGARTEASIDPEAVSQAVEQILQSPFGNVVTEMVLRPLRIDEPDQEPVVKLPYPEPQPVPYTVPREFIEAEEQLEEEDWKKAQQKKRKRRAAKKAARKATEKVPPEKGGDAKGQSSGDKQASGDKEPEKSADNASGGKKRRRGGRKPRPPKVEVGFQKDSDGGDSKAADGKEAKPDAEASKPAAKKAARKRPAKKAARKAARKSGKAAGQKSEEKDPKKSPDKPARKTARKTAKKAARKRSAKKSAANPDKGNKSAK